MSYGRVRNGPLTEKSHYHSARSTIKRHHVKSTIYLSVLRFNNNFIKYLFLHVYNAPVMFIPGRFGARYCRDMARLM